MEIGKTINSLYHNTYLIRRFPRNSNNYSNNNNNSKYNFNPNKKFNNYLLPHNNMDLIKKV